jgi:hypothetical protein
MALIYGLKIHHRAALESKRKVVIFFFQKIASYVKWDSISRPTAQTSTGCGDDTTIRATREAIKNARTVTQLGKMISVTRNVIEKISKNFPITKKIHL